MQEIYRQDHAGEQARLRSQKDVYRQELEQLMMQREAKNRHEKVGISKEEVSLNRRLVESMLTRGAEATGSPLSSRPQRNGQRSPASIPNADIFGNSPPPHNSRTEDAKSGASLQQLLPIVSRKVLL